MMCAHHRLTTWHSLAGVRCNAATCSSITAGRRPFRTPKGPDAIHPDASPDMADPSQGSTAWPLYGLATCGECGSPLQPTRSPGGLRVYECRGCGLSRAQADALEVLSCFKALLDGMTDIEPNCRADLPAMFAASYSGVIVFGDLHRVRFLRRTT